MAQPLETAPASADFAEHERTYEIFVRMAAISTVWVLCIVATLAIGGTSERWILAGFWLFVGTVASIVGAAIKGLDWRPGLVVLVIMLVTLLMVTR